MPATISDLCIHARDTIASVLASTHLLHDPRLSLRKSNVPTRFILDELDVDFPPFSAWLVVVVVVIVCCSGDARPLDASIVAVAIARRAQAIVLGTRAVLVVGVLNFGHGDLLRSTVKSLLVRR